MVGTYFTYDGLLTVVVLILKTDKWRGKLFKYIFFNFLLFYRFFKKDFTLETLDTYSLLLSRYLVCVVHNIPTNKLSHVGIHYLPT